MSKRKASDAGPPAKRAKTAMKYSMIGDMKVSQLALGCFAFAGDKQIGGSSGATFAKLHSGLWGDQPEEDTFATVKAALDMGINFFDNAEMYGDGYAEEVTGRALKASGYPRDSYYIATKVSEAFLAPALVREHVLQSIARLDCGYIDLMQIHWHSRAGLKTEKYPDRPLEAEVPLEDTLKELDALRKEGLIKHIGVCNFGPEDLKTAIATGVPISSNQVAYNLLWRGLENEVLPLCRKENIAVLPWGPLGQALLAGKFATADDVPAGRARTRLFCCKGEGKRAQARHGEAGLEVETFEAIDKFKFLAKALDQPLANCSLAWLRQQDGVSSVLMGARNVSQLERNLTSLDLELAPEVLGLFSDAGEAVKAGLGDNLDPYEGADSCRIK